MLEEKGKLKSRYEGGEVCLCVCVCVCVHSIFDERRPSKGGGESLLECGYRSAEWRGRN